MEKEKTTTTAAPTGCYKCGRPGHWSRDCPSSSAPNPNPTSKPLSSARSSSSGGGNGVASDPAKKPKKVPRTRAKLTPELLLSDDGLGYVLSHFPRSFKYHGRGHEVDDLKDLIGLYREWYSRLLPSHTFDQFVHKVEQVAATRRIKMCLRELRERVAKGGDPTKFQEQPIVDDNPSNEQEEINNDSMSNNPGESSLNNHDADDVQDMLQEIYDQTTEDLNVNPITIDPQSPKGGHSSEISITNEQRARMEANRLKALERAAARACLSVDRA